jgi:hypothetical protein
MSRRDDERPAHAASERLAAYADGGLDAEESKAVEAYLRAHPEAQRELAELERLLVDVRAAAPRPAQEPVWAEMAQSIERACAEAAAPRQRSLGARCAAWLAEATRPRLALAGGAAVVALALGASWLVRTSAPPVTPQVATDADDAAAAAVRSALPDLEAAWAADPTLHDVDGAEDDSVLAVDAEATPELLAIDVLAVLAGEPSAPEPRATEAARDEIEDDAADELLLPMANDLLLDTLTDEELDRLEQTFDLERAG